MVGGFSYTKLHNGMSGKPLGAEKGVIIPVKILMLIEKYAQQGQIGIQIINNRTLFIQLYDYYFSTSLIEEEFPNYRRVIPEKQQYLIQVDGGELSTAIRQVALLSEKTRRVTLSIFENTIIIDSDQAEVGKAKVQIGCAYSGPDTKIALNYSYILDPLKAMTEKEVVIGFTENNRALSLYPKSEQDSGQDSEHPPKEIHVIMPMQLD